MVGAFLSATKGLQLGLKPGAAWSEILLGHDYAVTTALSAIAKRGPGDI